MIFRNREIFISLKYDTRNQNDAQNLQQNVRIGNNIHDEAQIS